MHVGMFDLRYSVASGSRQDVGFNDDYASKGHEHLASSAKGLVG